MVRKPLARHAEARRGPGRRPTRGAILVGVLWVLVLLAFLAVALRLHLSGIADSVRVTEDKAAARILGEAALSHATAIVRRGTQMEGELPDRMVGTLDLSQGVVNYRVVNEALRVDLNSGAEPLIIAALRAAGASARQAETLAELIMADRDPDEEEEGEADELVDVPTLSFRNVVELGPQSGIPAQIAIGLGRHVTVSSGLEGIRLEEAPPELLEGIPDLPGSARRAIEAYRAGRMEREQLLAQIGELEYYTAEKTLSWRVEMDVDLVSGYRERYEAVIVIAPQDDRPFRVLDWRRLDGDE